MNKFKFYFVVISFAALLFSCNKNDDTPEPVPVRAFNVQYDTDLATIEGYLKSYYIVNDISNPDFADEDITFAKIPDVGEQKSIFDFLNSDSYPKLLTKEVLLHDITYKIYYLKLRADNESGKQPIRVDEVLTAYSGFYLSSKSEESVTTITATFFETVVFPQSMLGLDRTIRGWGEIFPKFKTGIYDATPSPNPASFTNFGAGVMFLPSGLAYFNSPPLGSRIPSYAPLVFTFKLYDLKRGDQDQDGVLSIDENVVDENGNFTNLDTDGDGRSNYLDIDDDGDGYLTKNEIKDPITGLAYSFDLIPTCGNSGNGKKKHLDSSCH
ncbi:FKBP-type peptidyl-prolyl cis-trans isomerase [Flavobacterium luteum]|uniref:FKBP-type peptidylprolyl isomerase n=1 Tax=Flavobacterium luteum TaxID=2026654 RepID=A0A7J5AFF5_9FLAO|nr:FKBP-type peptidylprolyl isomerase [Flavobacterium luteum]KAB1156304.1 FKBP-type peptidylprolyl isomerase [Flavobacterium luteum]